jgi:hypothetical protein
MLNQNYQQATIKNISNDISNFDLTDVPKKQFSNSRTSCFYTLADKNILSATLTRTKPCRLVLKKPNSEHFGICTREECSFAHSQEELELPVCMFGENCRIVHGKRDKNTNEIIPNSSCIFKHPFETVNEWMKRTNTVIPELPKTSNQSRIHLKNSVLEKRIPIETVKEANKQRVQTIFKSYSDIIQNKHQHIQHNQTKVSIINVPNKELAQFALKSLFEIGIYNVKIVVE